MQSGAIPRLYRNRVCMLISQQALCALSAGRGMPLHTNECEVEQRLK
uniref:Uncharacterized protein n=1 Tax=Picea glauca TaxID=3330 RepID=A0A124GP79_PICGL|nr:hypothetical protein ABT39_MTgene973 [Picea glauca]